MAKVDRLNNLLGQKDQLMAEVRRHLRLNPKPHRDRVTLPNITDRFNHTRTRQRKPTVHSFVAGRNVHQWQGAYDQEQHNPFRVLPSDVDVVTKKYKKGNETPEPFQGPCTVKTFCVRPCPCPHAKPGKHCPQPSGQAKKTFSSYQSKSEDMLNGFQVNKQLERLQIPSYPLPPSMLDYQKNYFTCIKDRPLKEHFKRSQFSKMQRTVFFKTLMTGYIKDDISRRKEQLKLDKWELEAISHELDVVKRTFKKFIDASNEDSVALVKDQLHAGYQREEVEAKLVAHKGILSTVKAQIFRLENQMSTLLLCRDLLLKLSPSAWRMKYQFQARRFSAKSKWLNDLSTLYQAYCKYYPEQGKDFFLDEAMELLFKEVATLGPPNIYFTESWQIAMVLRRKELDCINQISDIVSLERKNAEIEALSKELTKYRAAEIKIMSEKFEEGGAESEYQRKRVAELEATANDSIPKYIDTLFSGDIMLEAFALIEVLYTDFFGESRQTPEPLQMMIAIEGAIRAQKEELNEIEPKVLKYFEKKVDTEERKIHKAAMKAKRVYREVKSFVKTAKAMYSPPPIHPRTWKIPVRRSNVPPVMRKKSRASSKREDQYQHYQVNGILINDDLERSIDNAIAAYLGLPFRPSSPAEESDSSARHSSVLSYASTESLERAIYDKAEDWRQMRRASSTVSPSRESSMADGKEDLMVIEMGYDSDEELIKQNYEKKMGIVEKPQVLYDAKTLDDRFMVEGDDVKLAEKTRIHVSRDPTRTQKNNALSWR